MAGIWICADRKKKKKSCRIYERIVSDVQELSPNILSRFESHSQSTTMKVLHKAKITVPIYVLQKYAFRINVVNVQAALDRKGMPCA